MKLLEYSKKFGYLNAYQLCFDYYADTLRKDRIITLNSNTVHDFVMPTCLILELKTSKKVQFI
jgi:hypothetical protein